MVRGQGFGLEVRVDIFLMVRVVCGQSMVVCVECLLSQFIRCQLGGSAT